MGEWQSFCSLEYSKLFLRESLKKFVFQFFSIIHMLPNFYCFLSFSLIGIKNIDAWKYSKLILTIFSSLLCAEINILFVLFHRIHAWNNFAIIYCLRNTLIWKLIKNLWASRFFFSKKEKMEKGIKMTAYVNIILFMTLFTICTM